MLSSLKKPKRRLVIINRSNGGNSNSNIICNTNNILSPITSIVKSSNEQKMLAMIYELTKRYDILETKYNHLQQTIQQNESKAITLTEWLAKHNNYPMESPSDFLEKYFIVSAEDILRLEYCTFTELFAKLVSKMDWNHIHSPIVFVQSFRNEMYWKQDSVWEKMSKNNILSILTHCKKIMFGAIYKYRQQNYERMKKNEQLENLIDLIICKITDVNVSNTCNKLLAIMKKYMYLHVPKNVSKT